MSLLLTLEEAAAGGGGGSGGNLLSNGDFLTGDLTDWTVEASLKWEYRLYLDTHCCQYYDNVDCVLSQNVVWEDNTDYLISYRPLWTTSTGWRINAVDGAEVLIIALDGLAVGSVIEVPFNSGVGLVDGFGFNARAVGNGVIMTDLSLTKV